MRGLICIFLLACSYSYGQDSISNDIVTTLKYRKGTYRSFLEFKTNSPGFVPGMVDTTRSDKAYVRSLEKMVKSTYGYSDGKDVYINASIYSNSLEFVKILLVGSITYFEDQRGKNERASYDSYNKWGGVIPGFVRGSYEYPGWIIYLPDDDGRAYALDKKSLKSILTEADKELLEKFKAEKNVTYEVLLTYLIEFNSRAKKRMAK